LRRIFFSDAPDGQLSFSLAHVKNVEGRDFEVHSIKMTSAIGDLEFLLRTPLQLQSIQIQPGVFTRPKRPSRSNWVAPSLAKLIQSIFEYLDHGAPIARIPWELLDDSELSPFRKRVYRTIEHIPFGETRNYGWVAKQFRAQGCAQAVGNALAQNPFPILIPCHRVIRSSGDLGGYMGEVENGEKPRLKKHLLNLEASYLSPTFDFLEPLNSKQAYQATLLLN
jgi:methylated-DNA-[protein]-cysteine S-methyltransferase